MDSYGVSAKPVLNHVERAPKAGAGAIHLVNEANAGDSVFVCLSPDCFRLRLYAGDSIENHHTAIKNSQTTFYFSCEVDVARGINDVDLVIPPVSMWLQRR